MSNPKLTENDSLVPMSILNRDNRWCQRLQELQEFYCNQFGSEPTFFVRVPGRVNIIGEHVDYCGYPVLPMAIDQCILLAVGCTSENTLLQLRNLENSKFEDFTCDLYTLRDQLYQTDGPKWYKYYLCGVTGIYDTLEDNFTPIGMNIALCGDIPPASGLSSSSALVSAATLATAHVHKLPLERKSLASISARCERYIGTQGGGMDQAIAYLAKEGCAQYIEFQPDLLATPLKLPDKACFVVANSLAEKNKAASSDFNERVVECRLACRILAKKSNLHSWRNFTNFCKLQRELNCSLIQLAALVSKFLQRDSYDRSTICQELEVKEDEFESEFLTENTRHMQIFKLKQRAQHVLQESIRVLSFRSLCQEKSSGFNCQIKSELDSQKPEIGMMTYNDLKNCDEEVPLAIVLSELMLQSHHSLRDLYECSHPNLDRIVDLSNKFGVGARLTGAGWGGCIVALCDSIDTSTRYIQLLKEKYFNLLPANLREKYEINDFQDVVFTTFPQKGAEIFIAPIST